MKELKTVFKKIRRYRLDILSSILVHIFWLHFKVIFRILKRKQWVQMGENLSSWWRTFLMHSFFKYFVNILFFVTAVFITALKFFLLNLNKYNGCPFCKPLFEIMHMKRRCNNTLVWVRKLHALHLFLSKVVLENVFSFYEQAL